jgi:hypothetical protein
MVHFPSIALALPVADNWGRLDLRQPVPALNASLAATAPAHDLAVLSRDADDLRNTGVRLLNPFSSPKPAGN